METRLNLEQFKVVWSVPFLSSHYKYMPDNYFTRICPKRLIWIGVMELWMY